MAFRFEESVWDKKRQKAQSYINRIRYELGRKTRWQEQIGFLQKCRKFGLVPNGLCVKIPTSIQNSKVKGVNGKVAGMKVALKLELEMPKGWIDRTETWIVKSLRKSGYKIRLKPQKKV